MPVTAHAEHDHNHGHQHGHHHGHGHSHAAPKHSDFTNAFKIGIALNTAYVAVEALFGILAHSVALLADAGHNLTDVLGLLLAWGAAVVSRREPTLQHTYGLRRSSILAALLNAALLLVAVGAIVWESISRFSQPHPIMTGTVIWVATLGILVNGVSAWLFVSGRAHDLNVRAAFQHMAADAAVSAGVVIAAVVINATGWIWLDPAVSLAIAILIGVSSWQLLRDATNLALDAVPNGIDVASIKFYLSQRPGITDVHHLHVWPISTTHVALTAHLVAPAGHPGDAELAAMREHLLHDFKIDHATIQIESGAGCGDCTLV